MSCRVSLSSVLQRKTSMLRSGLRHPTFHDFRSPAGSLNSLEAYHASKDKKNSISERDSLLDPTTFTQHLCFLLVPAARKHESWVKCVSSKPPAVLSHVVC